MRQTLLALALLLFVPHAVHAHTHVWDIYFGPSYANASNLGGVHITFGLAPLPNQPLKKVSFVFDTSVHFGTHEQNDLRRLMVSGGVRLTPHDEDDRHLASVQVLVGKVWDDFDLGDTSGWGATFGVMYEYLLGAADGKGWAFRAEGDFVANEVDKFPRFSTGLAYHWKK